MAPELRAFLDMSCVLGATIFGLMVVMFVALEIANWWDE